MQFSLQSNPFNTLAVLSAAVFALLWNTLAVQASEPERTRQVVVFYPYMDGRPGILEFDKSLRDHLRDHYSQPTDVYNEYLDVTRFPDEVYQKQLAEFLRNKYAKKKLDVVIVGLKPAFDFILKYRSVICPEAPVIFAGVEARELQNVLLEPGMAGVPMQFQIKETLELALQLHPGAKRVYVISGSSPYDVYWNQQARLIFQQFAKQREVIFLADLSVPELFKTVEGLPADSIIYFMHILQDRLGVSYAAPDIVAQLNARTRVPIYGHVGSYLGKGIVGGRLMRFSQEAEHAASLAIRIFNGEKLEGVQQPTIVQSKSTVDWQQLRKWTIQREELPPDIVVENYEPSLWERYRWIILGVVALCIAETLLIVGLLLQRSSRQKAEARFRLSVEAALYGMIMLGRDGKIILANTQMEKLFGYTRDELLGSSVDLLVPELVREKHQQHREQFFLQPTERPMGMGRELFGRRKDGSEFPVEIGLNPILTEGQPCVLATIMDITERKRIETKLQSNQQELIALTGKLMKAQESESRRIARELHDDLNQNLALLTVELELLAKNPTCSIDQFRDKINEFSTRVKQLSSFVHDLSHQLHPAKIEQLGLVRSLHALCRDLSSTHDLVVDFVEKNIPQGIPNTVGLCLYRIAQEGLRNAIKHSGAEVVEVRLTSDGKVLEMTISDDGKGFVQQEPSEITGLGLLSMRERLRLVNGTIQIDSQPGQGTRIGVKVPLDQETSDSLVAVKDELFFV